MNQTIRFKSDEVEYYCPKCNKLISDDNHDRYLEFNLCSDDDEETYNVSYNIVMVPDDVMVGKCQKCGSDAFYADSYAMRSLVNAMIKYGFKIERIEDAFNFSVKGFRNLTRTHVGSISFKVPNMCKSEFNNNVSGMLVKEHDGIYDVMITQELDAWKLISVIESTMGDAGKLNWTNNYAPKILASLVGKGYGVTSAGFISNMEKQWSEYRIVLLDSIRACTNVGIGLYVNDNVISFEYYSEYADEYLQWVQSLPEYKEA